MVTKISMRATIAEMGPGEVVTIPLDLRSYNSIRNCASLLSYELGRIYSVKINRSENNCKVTRVS